MLSTFFDPLSPNIIIQILITGLHRFCWLLIERTRLNIKTIHVWWSFAKFSWSVCVIIHWGDEEKFGADHYWGFKGLCHAILVSFWKAKKCLGIDWIPKNNGLILLLKTILQHWNCFLSSVATDGKDGNGLKLEKIGPIFSSFDAMFSKITKKIIIVSSPWENSFDFFLVV